MRVSLTAVTLLACPVLACGKIQGSVDRQVQGVEEPSSTEDAPQQAAPAPPRVESQPPGETPVEPVREGSCSEPPPPLVLQSAGGEQAGVIGSYCVDNLSLGCGVCVDKVWLPSRSFTVAHPGDELTIAMPGARLSTNPRCTPACSLEVVITSTACFQGQVLPKNKVDGVYADAQRTVIAQDQPWTLTAAPGLYFVTVNGGEFSTPEGLSGGPSGIFGLLVDPDRERTIVDAATFYADCRASSLPDAGSDAAGIDADGGVASDGG